MTVRELIEELQKFDQDAQVWQMYDPPYACWEIEFIHLVGDDAHLVDDFKNEGVRIGDYAVRCG